MQYFTTCPSPLGLLTLASDGENLTGLWLEGQKYFGSAITEETSPKDDLSVFAVVKHWLDRYFAGEKPAVAELPLRPDGSEFRQEVWKILCGIPYGQLITYGGIAKQLAAATGKKSMSSQAVGGAVGHNPISIIIPCHRVVGTNGSLTGYAGGVSIKVRLLQLEGADMSRLFVPKRGTAL